LWEPFPAASKSKVNWLTQDPFIHMRMDSLNLHGVSACLVFARCPSSLKRLHFTCLSKKKAQKCGDFPFISAIFLPLLNIFVQNMVLLSFLLACWHFFRGTVRCPFLFRED
jgi:hypothetical protein